MLIVYRYYNPHGTVGFVPELDIWTIERPWANNQVGISCVPEGDYVLERHEPTSVKLPDGWSHTYAMVNESLSVSHYPKPGCKRNVCLFGHIANYPKNVEGCVGFGESHIIHDNELMVTNSAQATKTVLRYLDTTGIRQLRITSQP